MRSKGSIDRGTNWYVLMMEMRILSQVTSSGKAPTRNPQAKSFFRDNYEASRCEQAFVNVRKFVSDP